MRRSLEILTAPLQFPRVYPTRYTSPFKLEHSHFLKAAYVSPSPGGEGRGEGGRQSDFIHLYIRQHPLIRLPTSAATRATP